MLACDYTQKRTSPAIFSGLNVYNKMGLFAIRYVVNSTAMVNMEKVFQGNRTDTWEETYSENPCLNPLIQYFV